MNIFIRRSQWILLSLFVFLVLAVSVDAQIGGSPARRVARMSDAQAGSCTTAKKGQIYFSTDSNGLFYCNGTNWVATGGGAGDALTTNPLSQFAATTSAQFAGVISDETGTGAVVLASGPTLTSPVIGTKVNLPRVTALPGTPSAGDTVIVTDDSAAGACDSAAGSAQSLCQYNGAAWVSLGDGSGSAAAAGSDTQLQRNNAGSFGGISGATSDGTNVTFGSGNLRATRFRSTTSIDDANGNEVIITPATTSAVNEVTITNSATGNPVSIAATGGDANIDLNLAGKGTGAVNIGGTATGVIGLRDTDQSHFLNITVGSNLTANRPLTFTTGDAARTVTINGDVTLSGTNTGDTAIVSATTYYVCPAALTNCAYDGDGGQAATPSDSNECITKALPCATIAGARDKFTGKDVRAVVKIQLADSGAEAYFPNAVEFSNMTEGQPSSSGLEKALALRDDTYPAGYIWIHGNATTPNNVNVTGAATAAGTTSTKQSAFVSRGSNLRVSSMKINYFRADNADTGAINCYGANCYVEEINATSDHTGNDGALVSGFFGTKIHLGDQFNVTNSAFVRANAGSQWQTSSPAGYASCNCAADSAVFMMFTNEQSHGMFQGGTWNFTGTGAYYAHAAWTNSSINWNGDATTSITYNAANATGLYAAQGSKIWEGAGTNMTVTVTALSRRAQARSGSYVHYGGTTAATLADLADGNSVIANGSFPFVTKTTSPFTAYQDINEVSTPGTPAANAVRLYVRDKAGVSELFYKNDAGTERDLSAGAGSAPSIGGTLTSATAGSVLFAGSATFEQDNTNFFWDDTNNRLKIGNPTNADGYPLSVRGSGAGLEREGGSATLRFDVFSSTQAFHAPNFSALRGRGTFASKAAVVSGDTLFNLDVSGQETTTTANTAARIQVIADGTPGTNDMPGRIEFCTTPDGAASPICRVRVQANGLTSLYSGAAVASAATITPTGNLFHVTGTTTITSVSGTGVTAGTKITIIFDGVLTFTDGSNLKLAGNFITAADSTITLVYDGTNWFEVSRSTN